MRKCKWIESACLTFLILATVILEGFCQSPTLQPSQHLSVSEGLAHNGVTCIYEDSKGYLWVGTFDGLNRYDGYKLKVFKNTFEDKIFISNRIRAIAEDSAGNLWIGSDEGISIYNYDLETFKDIYSNKLTNAKLSGPIVRSIFMNAKSNQTLCITERQGVLIFKDDYTFVDQYLPSNASEKEPSNLFEGMALDEDNYLFATSNGLLLFDLETKQFQKYLEEEIEFSSSITKIEDNKLLVTLTNGFAVIDYSFANGSYSFTLDFVDMESSQIKTAFVDQMDNLWLGTLRSGVVKIKDLGALKSNNTYTSLPFPADSKGLRISCFAETKRGLWVGTFNKGIYQFDQKSRPFNHSNTTMEVPYGLVSNDIVSVAALDSHRVYVTSLPGGLGLFNTKDEKFEAIPFDLSEDYRSKVSAVFVDSKKNTWLKLAGELGTYRVRSGSNKLEKITRGIYAPYNESLQLRPIVEDKSGYLWSGSLNDVFRIGLDKTDGLPSIESLKTNSFFTAASQSPIRAIYSDPQFNFIWVGTSTDGLFRIKLGEEEPLASAEIKQYLNNPKDQSSISSNFVSSIIRLPNGELWVGTERGGICKVLNSDAAATFLPFSEKQGLSNNVVKSILPDGENNLWVTTNVGLNKFNTTDLKFRKFNIADGLPFEDFKYASAKLDNGLMVVSGNEGFCYFNPDDISSNEPLPELTFGDLKIYNKIISPGDILGERVLLEKRLAVTDDLELRYDENVFSIEVNSLHFSNPESHYLKYQLLPINEDWIEIPSDQQYISYQGLQPGDYTLQVMASNSLNQWTAAKELKIKISPPIWKTTLAYIAYAVLTMLLLASIIFVVLKFQSLNHNLEIEKIEKNNVAEINAAKLRFFSNISHEIKTPITLISGPVSLLLKELENDNDAKEKLLLIQRQSNKITQLVDQVHDFQKAEANHLKMHHTHFCFDDFIKELMVDFEFIVKNDNKVLSVIGADSKIYILADKEKLEIVFNNLLNNALKYTKSGDEITVEYKRQGKELIVSVKDSGKGISNKDLPFVFDRFYHSPKQQDNDLAGAGIGLAFSKRLVDMHYGLIRVESQVNEGANFIIRLPVVQEESIQEKNTKEAEILAIEEKAQPSDQLNEKVDLSKIKVDPSLADAKVFLVEDNTDMRMFVSNILSPFFKVQAFANGQECLDAMKEEWPDILISDILMPDINGLELCNRIKSNIKTSHIPIILLTACITVDDQIDGIKVGADAYIKKPFNIPHLIARTESLLQNRKQLRERFQIDFPTSLKKSKENADDHIFLEKLYDLMAKNLDNQELDLDDFAKELYLNRTHFYQKVKALTNETPYELLKIFRLKKAAALLVQQDLSVKEVFMMTGFKSRTHFSKLFKEKYEVSPGKYAKGNVK